MVIFGTMLAALCYFVVLGVSHPVAPAAAIIFGVVSGVITTPFVFVALRHARIVRATIVTFGAVLGWIIFVAPLHPRVGFYGSYLVLALALLLCSRWRWTIDRSGRPRTSTASDSPPDR